MENSHLTSYFNSSLKNKFPINKLVIESWKDMGGFIKTWEGLYRHGRVYKDMGGFMKTW